MALITLKCPSCGAQLNFDIMKEFGFCQYCGTKVFFETAANDTSGKKTIEKYKLIAMSAFDCGNYEEASTYFTKILEIDFDQWEALWYKGLSAAWRSTYYNTRIYEAIKGAENAISSPGFSSLSSKEKYEKIEDMKLQMNLVINACIRVCFQKDN